MKLSLLATYYFELVIPLFLNFPPCPCTRSSGPVGKLFRRSPVTEALFATNDSTTGSSSSRVVSVTSFRIAAGVMFRYGERKRGIWLPGVCAGSLGLKFGKRAGRGRGRTEKEFRLEQGGILLLSTPSFTQLGPTSGPSNVEWFSFSNYRL